MISFRSLSRDVEIGANSYLLDFDGTRVLLDAGMHPKRERLDALPDFSEIEYGSIDAALLSHAHLDHSGALPILQRTQPEMPVYLSAATSALADALLHNAVNVMDSKRIELDIPDYPLYSHREVGQSGKKWEARRIGHSFEVEGSDTQCTLFESGHILGAVGAMFEHHGRSVFYSGDVHFEDQSIVRGAEFPESGVDTLILECTRGDSERAPEYTRQAEGERMADAIERCLDRGGSVMIPVFAMGKTQETITLLYEMQRTRRLRPLPFHIGGLSIKMTTIYDRFTKRVRRNHHGMHILRTPGLISTPRERGKIPTLTNGQVYVVSSGMMSQHTMSNRIARQFIHNPKNLLIAVGYADPASPLAAILASEPGDDIELDPRYEPVKRECEVERFDFSGHAPREQLVDYVAKLKPETTILVHGDKPAVERMKASIEGAVPDTEVIVPTSGKDIEIG